MKDNELLTQQQVFSEQLRLAAHEVGEAPRTRLWAIGLVKREMTVPAACSPQVTNDWIRFKIPNTICLLHAASA